MSNNKLKISKKNFFLLKTLIDLQIVIEDLDFVGENSTFSPIKKRSNEYLKFLEREIIPIINNTFETNKDLMSDMIENVRKVSMDNNKYFEIND